MDVILVGHLNYVLEAANENELIDRLRIFDNIEDAKQWCLKDAKEIDFNTFDDSGEILMENAEVYYISGEHFITITGEREEPESHAKDLLEIEYMCQYFHIPGFMEASKMKEYLKVSSGKNPCTLHIQFFHPNGAYWEGSDIHNVYSSDNGPYIHLLRLILLDLAPTKLDDNLASEDKRDFKLLQAMDSKDYEEARKILLEWLQTHEASTEQ